MQPLWTLPARRKHKAAAAALEPLLRLRDVTGAFTCDRTSASQDSFMSMGFVLNVLVFLDGFQLCIIVFNVNRGHSLRV